MDIQKEIDAKLAACDAEIESRMAAFSLTLREQEDKSDALVADKKAEAEKYAAIAAEERRNVEHLQESRRRIEQDIATLKLTLPELRAELETVQENNRQNLEDHQVRLTNLRVNIAEAQNALGIIRRDIEARKAEGDANKEAYTAVVNALLADVNSLTATRARLENDAGTTAKVSISRADK